MSRFNKYAFLGELKESISRENPTDVWEFIHHEIDNNVIYYHHCFAICEELHMTDWSDNQFGEITNISQLAFLALEEFICDNLEIPA